MMDGWDRWTGSSHKIRVDSDGPHVLIAVEATGGANEGEALITPAQARAMAGALTKAAEAAEAASAWEA